MVASLSFEARLVLILTTLILHCDMMSSQLQRDNVVSISRSCVDVKLLTFTTPGSQLLTGLPFTGPAISLALEEIRVQYNLNLSNVFLTRNDMINCEDMVAGAYLVAEYVYRNFSDGCFILLNPGCDDEIPLGRLSTEWNTPILTSGTTYPQFYDPTEFPTMVSFGGVDLEQLTQGLFDMFEYYLWKSIVVIHDISPAASAIYPGIVRIIQRRISSFARFIVFPIDTSSGAPIAHRRILDNIRPVSRVVLLLVVAHHARAFMISARKMGKIAEEYVFICAEPFHSVRRLGELTWKTGDADDEIAKVAFRSLLHLTGSCCSGGNDPEQHVRDWIKADGIEKYNASYLENEATNEISMSAYYSVKSLGEVLNETIRGNFDMRDGRAFAQRFTNRSFEFNQHQVVVGPTRVRVMDYCIRDFDPNSGQLHAVLSYNALTRKFRPILDQIIDWGTANNLPPRNEPKCGYMGDNPICRGGWTSSLVASVAVPVALAVTVGMSVSMWYAPT